MSFKAQLPSTTNDRDDMERARILFEIFGTFAMHQTDRGILLRLSAVPLCLMIATRVDVRLIYVFDMLPYMVSPQRFLKF